MSLDKAIASGKEKRKPYRGSKSVDSSCRNHGDCPYCANGRQHKHRIAKLNERDAYVYYRDEFAQDNV